MQQRRDLVDHALQCLGDVAVVGLQGQRVTVGFRRGPPVARQLPGAAELGLRAGIRAVLRDHVGQHRRGLLVALLEHQDLALGRHGARLAFLEGLRPLDQLPRLRHVPVGQHGVRVVQEEIHVVRTLLNDAIEDGLRFL